MTHHNMFLIIIASITLTFLTACAKEPPKCSDEKTLSLVKSIILDMVGSKGKLTEKEIKDNLKIEYPRATAYDEKIKKYSCDADFIANDTYKLPIRFESQLDDNGKHIVAVSNISPGDSFMVASALANIKRNNTNYEVNPQIKQATISDNKASAVTNTRFGPLEVKNIGENEKGLIYASKVFFKREYGFLSIDKVYQVDNSDVALICNSEGGSGTIDSHFFVMLSKNANPIVSESFFGQGSEIQVVQNKSQLSADLGYENGFHKVMTYQNGKMAIQKTDERNKRGPADESNCNYLYKDIYSSYVDQKECQGPPEEISGMATARAYYSMQNDPRLNLKAFQVIAKASCKNGSTITYAEFQKKVCGK